ncbi:RNA-binding cell elongation regulator Jag/EloR [Bacillus sp. 165]|uniref:RNA-binding cell elongation regulator Jag/EloR n=1 Tax=Bacillus sp. 165 TaxID=1529117 RepID=UPI001ADB9E2D|nr:protein jag [Bacillus sp. 165]
MNIITAKGQTVEEAVQSALSQLQKSKAEVEIRVVEEGKKGFLGLIGNRPAIVEVMVRKNPVQEVELYLKSIFKEMQVDIKVETIDKGRDVTYLLSGEKVALLIGKRGGTLNSLQYLAQLVANKYTKHYINVVIDAENYREKRKGTLEILAQKLSRQVSRTKEPISLEPMPSFERKIIHQILSGHPSVTTTSAGAEPHRHVVISPK